MGLVFVFMSATATQKKENIFAIFLFNSVNMILD